MNLFKIFKKILPLYHHLHLVLAEDLFNLDIITITHLIYSCILSIFNSKYLKLNLCFLHLNFIYSFSTKILKIVYINNIYNLSNLIISSQAILSNFLINPLLDLYKC